MTSSSSPLSSSFQRWWRAQAMVESRGGAQRRRRLPPAWIRQRSPSPFTAVADPVVGRRSGGGSGDREVRWWSGGGEA
ncbi:hypothetical protein DAI22_05g114300 [Oryza sativa Japonica Group]|nr:hypothetical protein DAI22_05g114300 [Oryza sativa Japonica Group]